MRSSKPAVGFDDGGDVDPAIVVEVDGDGCDGCEDAGEGKRDLLEGVAVEVLPEGEGGVRRSG